MWKMMFIHFSTLWVYLTLNLNSKSIQLFIISSRRWSFYCWEIWRVVSWRFFRRHRAIKSPRRGRRQCEDQVHSDHIILWRFFIFSPLVLLIYFMQCQCRLYEGRVAQGPFRGTRVIFKVSFPFIFHYWISWSPLKSDTFTQERYCYMNDDPFFNGTETITVTCYSGHSISLSPFVTHPIIGFSLVFSVDTQ